MKAVIKHIMLALALGAASSVYAAPIDPLLKQIAKYPNLSVEAMLKTLGKQDPNSAGECVDYSTMGCTALRMVAAYSTNLSLVKALIAAGADVNARDEGGRTPLYYANTGEIVKALIAVGADVNARDEDGRTPLHHANTGEAAKALIAAGADVNARDEGGWTPLHYAKTGEIVKALIAAGADVNARDGSKHTPLIRHILQCNTGYCTSQEDIQRYSDIVQALIKAGAKVDSNTLELLKNGKLYKTQAYWAANDALYKR